MDRIVVGIDGSEPSRRALRWAIEEARLRGADVEAVHAWTPPYVGGYPYTATVFDPVEYERAARQLLDDVVDEADAAGLSAPIERLVIDGPAARGLLDAAKDAALVVVGSRGRGGFAGLLLGSTSQQVCHHATCPVVVIPDES
jgi:nucleotide-binding universal stress UspA family protein